MGAEEIKSTNNRRPWVVIAVLGGCVILVLCICVCVLAIGALAAFRVGSVGVDLGAPEVTIVEEVGREGEARSGDQIFKTAGCSACHSLTPGGDNLGPSLAGIGQRAGTRVSGMTAESYLTESILDPKSYVVEGFRGEIMPDNYAQLLSDEELKALVVFLLSQ